ncbi:MAG: 3-keto-5-aminohexanoate cleavage protein [Rhodospirillaceae bacterium]|jgi:uncharacterized protein (DUF849 family)|nr:3-keto-5-aminohexanoate cleavage protein [Rhodospirillaceae bacterium]MBT6137186.1 3-keto-5-aminohexanoate cleavage protein [Rhodospirillaceae bacterium]
MATKTVITCALTGGADSADMNPAVPVTPEQIAKSALDAEAAGASIVHIHVRDPETGKASMDPALYREVVARLRDTDTKLIINLTTGPGANFIPGDEDPIVAAPGSTLRRPEERTAHVEELRPEICSLDVATLNFGPRVFMNTPDHLRIMAQRIKDAGVKPELEVFDTGHVRLANQLVSEGLIEGTPVYQLCLGISWGAGSTPESLLHMRSLLPEGANWSAFGISRQQMPIVALASMVGGHCRVGLEDNLYISRGELASGNGQLVERAVQVIHSIGGDVATPDEAREIFGLAPRA